MIDFEFLRSLIFDLDPLYDVISHLYSNTGRPSELQPEIFRSLVLMVMLGFNPDTWVLKLRVNSVLRIICGFFDKLVKQILDGQKFDCRPEKALQKIFANVCVNKSAEMDLQVIIMRLTNCSIIGISTL